MTSRMAYYERNRQERHAELERKYNELIMAVGNKYPGETRHQTALRYIQERESATEGPCNADTQS